MSYHSGQVCKETGLYKCVNDNNKITLKAGDYFPDCETCSINGKGTRWIMVNKD